MKISKQELWNLEYQQSDLPTSRIRDDISSHVQEFIKFLSSKGIQNGNILDLGCGYGNDARAFAQQGFNVYACDISEVAISIAQERTKEENLAKNIQFSLMDIGTIWKHKDNSFDATFDGTTFINLTTTIETTNYFQELKRTLKNHAFGLLVTPVLPDEFYKKLYTEQGSNPVICPSGISQRVYSEEKVVSLLQEYFVLQDITKIRKKNKMYGKEYDRHLMRIIFQNEK